MAPARRKRQEQLRALHEFHAGHRKPGGSRRRVIEGHIVIVSPGCRLRNCQRGTSARRISVVHPDRRGQVDAASGATMSAMTPLDGLRLGRILKAGIPRLLSRQEHLNKINVFPVPDGDTGTNLAMTMNAVLSVLRDAGSACRQDADARRRCGARRRARQLRCDPRAIFSRALRQARPSRRARAPPICRRRSTAAPTMRARASASRAKARS